MRWTKHRLQPMAPLLCTALWSIALLGPVIPSWQFPGSTRGFHRPRLEATAAQSPQAQDDQPAPKPIHKRIHEPSIVSCGGCHLQEYREWSGSLHGRAWTNSNVQIATRNFAKQGCRDCHSPQPVLLSGLDRPPDYRDFNQEDGVHCLSCHGLEDGVAASRTLEAAPCKPRFEPRLKAAELCFPCHEPTHGAFEEYRRSDAFALGLTCANCHMQAREDGRGFSHGAHGGMNADFVRRGLAWTAAVEGQQLRLSLRNRSGHRFPGEIPSRSLLIRIQHDQQEPLMITLRRPRKEEQREDNRLQPDEQRVLLFELPESTNTLSVQIYFRPLPLLPLEGCFKLGDFHWQRPLEEH